MQINTHDAKSQLSRLIDLALAGEEVIIARNNRPLIRLTPIGEGHRSLEFGTEPDLIRRMDDDFDEPLEDFREYME
ncbi:type II toxin-antitoxin system Phd/YefM family antitoxin [Endothiovibrio diazotrophicus]